MTVIDIHTHMLTQAWIDLLREHGAGKYSVKDTRAGQRAIHLYDVPFMTLFPGMWDYDLRIKAMDAAGVDIAVVSLTCPNVFWGDRAVSLRAAQMVNDSMAEQQRARPDRIRWFASLPWQYADDAVAELARATAERRGRRHGARQYRRRRSDQSEIRQRSGRRSTGCALPVLVHPTTPQGLREMHMDEFNMIPAVGFMFDTTLAFTRMILAGFIDRYPNLKLIAAHGGATLPYLAGRLDRCHETIPAFSEVIKDKPSSYLRRIWYDTVVYDQRGARAVPGGGGLGRARALRLGLSA